MHLCHLSFRLKGHRETQHLSFESSEAAQSYLIDNGLQVVVGKLDGIKNPQPIIEKAAMASKADWFEFTHTEE